jgi:hypothetical protein
MCRSTWMRAAASAAAQQALGSSASTPRPTRPLARTVQHYALIEDKELAPLEELIAQFQGKTSAKQQHLQQLI